MDTDSEVESAIDRGEFWEMCRKCWVLLRPATWTWTKPGSISTIHICDCGRVEHVAGWSTFAH